MTIQIKNKYLKRLLKKTGIVIGGSSNDITKIIKGGGRPEELQKILTERANQLFKIALITIASSSISDTSKSKFISPIPLEPKIIKGKIDTLVKYIDDKDFDFFSDSSVSNTKSSYSQSNHSESSSESFITISSKNSFVKKAEPITVAVGNDDVKEITLQYYNLKKDDDDDPNTIKIGVIKWGDNVYKGEYKMNKGVPVFVSGTLKQGNIDPLYMLNDRVVTDEGILESTSGDYLRSSSLSDIIHKNSQESIVPPSNITYVATPESSGYESAVSIMSETELKQQEEQLKKKLEEGYEEQQKQLLEQERLKQMQQKQPQLQQQPQQQPQPQLQQQLQQQPQPQLQQQPQLQLTRYIPSESNDSLYDFDNLHTFQDLQIANAEAKIAEDNARLQALKYEQQLLGRKRLPPISNIEPIVMKDVTDSISDVGSMVPVDRSAVTSIDTLNPSISNAHIAPSSTILSIENTKPEYLQVEQSLENEKKSIVNKETVDDNQLGSVIAEAVEKTLSTINESESSAVVTGKPLVEITSYLPSSSVNQQHVVDFTKKIIQRENNILNKIYTLQSKAGNTDFYKTIDNNSIDTIINYHESNNIFNTYTSNVEITDFINEGSFNLVLETNDDKKVFRILKPKYKQNDKQNNKIKNYELYGFIVQYYFTQKCTNYVCKVFDFGIMKYDDCDLIYGIIEKATFDMEYFFKKYVFYIKINISTIKQIFNNLYQAIKCIHAEGFVHSDIKPSNIGIIVEDVKTCSFRPILLDFGLTVKTTQKCIGLTKRYAPHNYNNNNCLQQMDLYAFGMMLLEALFTVPDKFSDKKYTYDFFSNMFNTKEELLKLLHSFAPNVNRFAYYNTTDGDLEACILFISSLLFSPFDLNTNITNIDASWLGNTSDFNNISCSIKHLDTIPEESNEDISLSNNNSSINASQNTDLSETIATAIESALKSKSSANDSDTNLSKTTPPISDEMKEQLSNLSSLTMDFLSNASAPVEKLKIKAKPILDILESQVNVLPTSLQNDKIKTVVRKVTDVFRTAQNTEAIANGVVAVKDIFSGVSSANDSSLSGLHITINMPEQASGFLLVCPSSKQVVGIFNVDNSMPSDNKCSFLYDKDLSTTKSYSQPFLSSNNHDCISDFINTINTIINDNNSCMGNPNLTIQIHTVSSLFANAFMSAITNLPVLQTAVSASVDNSALSSAVSEAVLSALSPGQQSSVDNSALSSV